MGPEQTAVKNCDICVRKAVCILYHGYTTLELRFGGPSPIAPEELSGRIGEALAAKCSFFLGSDCVAER